MAERAKADWHNIDIDTLPESLRTPYELYKKSYKQAKADREAFEADMISAIDPPKGKRVVFGYNFGKLSVAVVDDDKPAAKSAPKALSLADLCKR